MVKRRKTPAQMRSQIRRAAAEIDVPAPYTDSAVLASAYRDGWGSGHGEAVTLGADDPGLAFAVIPPNPYGEVSGKPAPERDSEADAWLDGFRDGRRVR